MVECRKVKGIDGSQLRDNLAGSPLVTEPPDVVDDLVDLCYATLLDLWNKHGPEREKVVLDLTSSAWTDEAVIRAKQAKRRAERKKRKTGLGVHIELYKQARDNVKKAIKHDKAGYFRLKLGEAASDSKKMFFLNRQDWSDFLTAIKPQEG